MSTLIHLQLPGWDYHLQQYRCLSPLSSPRTRRLYQYLAGPPPTRGQTQGSGSSPASSWSPAGCPWSPSLTKHQLRLLWAPQVLTLTVHTSARRSHLTEWKYILYSTPLHLLQPSVDYTVYLSHTHQHQHLGHFATAPPTPPTHRK